MLGTDIRMDLLIQYGMQAASGLLILGIGAFLAKSAGRYTHKALGKIEMESLVRLLTCSGCERHYFSLYPIGDAATTRHSDFSFDCRLWRRRSGNWPGPPRDFSKSFCGSEYYHHQTFSHRRIYRYPGRTWRSPSHRYFHDQT